MSWRPRIGFKVALALQHGVPSPTGPFEQGLSFAAAMLRWTAKGFPVVSESAHFNRSAECSLCSAWDAFGQRCRQCGCGDLKHWLATERCPLGNWPAP